MEILACLKCRSGSGCIRPSVGQVYGVVGSRCVTGHTTNRRCRVRVDSARAARILFWTNSVATSAWHLCLKTRRRMSQSIASVVCFDRPPPRLHEPTNGMPPISWAISRFCRTAKGPRCDPSGFTTWSTMSATVHLAIINPYTTPPW